MGGAMRSVGIIISLLLVTGCTVEINPDHNDPDNPIPTGVLGEGSLDQDWGSELDGIANPLHEVDYVEHLPRGEEQRQLLCSRGLDDRLTRWYCDGATAPQINGLADVLAGLQLDPQNAGTTRFAISGHSSSLVTRKTSVLNPRAVIFTRDGTPDYTALGFIRGDGFAEVAAFDESRQDINLFLVSYRKACFPYCSNAEKFLPEQETGWQSVTVFEADDLKNTVFDCKQCHEPGGLDTGRILRMQELVDPWTHWFRDNRGTRDLLDEYRAAHVNEDFAGIAAANITNSDPADLEDLVRAAGFGNQPNLFEGDNINQDNINVVDPNATWMALYQNAVDGTMIAPPFYGINPYNQDMVNTNAQMYRDVADGTAGRDTMPDLTDMFADEYLSYLSYRPAEGLTAQGIVQHKCGTCHDGRFPGISRDNFRVVDFPDNLPPNMANKISQRLGLSHASRLRMPPLAFAELSDAEIAMIRDAMK